MKALKLSPASSEAFPRLGTLFLKRWAESNLLASLEIRSLL